MVHRLHLCAACKHARTPIRATAFRPGQILTGNQFGSATRELTETAQERLMEEERVAEGLPFDTPPQFFLWCARFTLSSEEIEEINRRLRLGDHGLASDVIEHDLAMIDEAKGVLVPIYKLCHRENPNHDCSAFAGRVSEGS